MLHTHPLELAAGSGPSQFTLKHDHEDGDKPHVHTVTPDGMTATSTTFINTEVAAR